MIRKLSEEYYSALPHRDTPPIDSLELFEKEKELLQLLCDLLDVGETVGRTLYASETTLRLRALRC